MNGYAIQQVQVDLGLLTTPSEIKQFIIALAFLKKRGVTDNCLRLQDFPMEKRGPDYIILKRRQEEERRNEELLKINYYAKASNQANFDAKATNLLKRNTLAARAIRIQSQDTESLLKRRQQYILLI